MAANTKQRELKRMELSDLRFPELLTMDEAAGTIHFQHRRMVLFDADATGLMRKELIHTLGQDRTRRLLTRFGYACGYRDALTSKEMFAWNSITDWWAIGPRLHTLEGIVQVRPLHFAIDPDRGIFATESEWRNSYEAEQHLRHIGPSTAPVCWTLTGYASGHASAIFGSPVYCVEKECVGKGDARCLVVGRAATDLQDDLRVLQEDHQPENLDAELRRLLTELEQRSRELAQQQEKVHTLESHMYSLQQATCEEDYFAEMIGTSPAFKQIVKSIETVATTDATVLICGETGTGKELIAHAVHTRSARSHRPFVTINCAALPTGLVESELFGHEKGAFTGAHQRKLGRIQLADGGTLFLDEVGELSLETQAKFLRVLQDGTFERVGGTHSISADVRVLAATNQPLDTLVAAGKFRSDLFYRLNVFPIQVPPLRERPGDIALLTTYFAQKFRARFKKPISSIDPASLARLQQYAWPGNVRELEHLIERAVLLAEGEVLFVDLPLSQAQAATATSTEHATSPPLRTLEEMERAYIEDVLRHTRGLIAGKGGAAELLGLPASTLRSRMKKLGVTYSTQR